MANLSKDQIDELKEKGFITQVVPSESLADNTVDQLKLKKFVTKCEPSADIEEAVTHGVPVTGVYWEYHTTSLYASEETNVGVHVVPEDASNKNISFLSSNDNVVTVESYNNEYATIKGIGEGIATITATSEDGGFTDVLEVEVEAWVPVTGVSVTGPDEPIAPGEDASLQIEIEPEDASNKNVTVVSSDESIFQKTYRF